MHKAIIAWATSLAALGAVTGCTREPAVHESPVISTDNRVLLANAEIKRHEFLQCMYKDEYFPRHLVDKGKRILLQLCDRIEKEQPADQTALYVLTHAATNDFNNLAEEFFEAESEIETGARDCIASDFDFIARAYGFQNVDVEEMIATRDW